jgi:hypothetical protein
MFQAGGWFMAKRARGECLDYVEQNWPDIRLKNLRDKLEQAGPLMRNPSGLEGLGWSLARRHFR